MIPIRDSVPTRNFAVLTLLVFAVNTIVFLRQLGFEQTELMTFFQRYGVVPSTFLKESFFEPTRYLSLLTSQFLHGSFTHILMNMWILWIFAPNVEDRMGPLRFLLFYLICGLAACLSQIFIFPSSEVPMVGASGAISGVMGSYLLLYPRARILTMIPIFFYPLLIQVSAFFYLVYWFVLQLLSGGFALVSPSGAGVAWWAHVGGFLAGLLLTGFFIRRSA